MPPRAPSQVRVETLIARGRLVLAVFLLLALRVATPRGSESAFGVALAFLGYAGALGLLVRTRFGDGPKWPGATHAIDLGAPSAHGAVGTENNDSLDVDHTRRCSFERG